MRTLLQLNAWKSALNHRRLRVYGYSSHLYMDIILFFPWGRYHSTELKPVVKKWKLPSSPTWDIEAVASRKKQSKLTFEVCPDGLLHDLQCRHHLIRVEGANHCIQWHQHQWWLMVRIDVDIPRSDQRFLNKRFSDWTSLLDEKNHTSKFCIWNPTPQSSQLPGDDRERTEILLSNIIESNIALTTLFLQWEMKNNPSRRATKTVKFLTAVLFFLREFPTRLIFHFRSI